MPAEVEGTLWRFTSRWCLGSRTTMGVVSFSDWLLAAAEEGDDSDANRSARFGLDVDGFRALHLER